MVSVFLHKKSTPIILIVYPVNLIYNFKNV